MSETKYPRVLNAFDRNPVRYEEDMESRTKQAHKDETDINRIMQKYQKTGLLDHVNKYQGEYGDFSEVTDFQSALNKIHESQEMFGTLPSSIRKQFDNDPGKFLNFVEDPNNFDAAVDLGLFTPLEPAEPGGGTSGEAVGVSPEPTPTTSDEGAPPPTEASTPA